MSWMGKSTAGSHRPRGSLDWFLWKMPALWWRTRLCGPTRTRLASSRCHKSGNLYGSRV